MLARTIVRLSIVFGIGGLSPSPAIANIPNATEQDARWFAGKWATGPADAPEFVVEAADCKAAVEIVPTGPATIRRTVRLRNAQSRSSEFTVKTFNGNFPWWSKDGIGGPVAKRTGTDSFVLAATRNGKADWSNALKHIRCPG